MSRLRPAGMLALLFLLLCLAPAMAEDFVVAPPASPAPSPVPTASPVNRPEPFTAYPPLDAQGFLQSPLVQDGPAFIRVDEEAGRWIYISENLRVDIERCVYKAGRKPRVYFFIAHIHLRGGEHFRAYSKDPVQPARVTDKPENIAAQHHLVYAQNGDLFTWRLENKRYAGVIIRSGKVLSQQTYGKATVNGPPLDELSLYADGHIEINYPGVFTPAQYLDKGALDVLAFGPTLLKDGVKDPRLASGHFSSLEPRSALGVVAPGHLVGILVEGRNKRSNGAGLDFVAERLLEEGCLEAFTLDGGQTAAMVFLGDTVMDPGTYNGYTKTRRQPDVVGIGVTQQLPARQTQEGK
ncbi:MAG: phosphodiester glycosidase family protein [Christensenellales bacterium]